MAAGEDVYCTLLMSDAYLPGAAVLAHSLRDCGTTKKLACLVTSDSLSSSTLDELKTLYNYVIPVARIVNPNPKNLYLMNRADLLYTFTKINLWRQTQFRKIVYLDADIVALRAPEELFDLGDAFAAAPDVGWPDAFNTGVMVLSPSMGDFYGLQNLATAGDSFDGADQGLINQYYEHKPWKRLSFSYNSTPSANYQYEPAYRYYKHAISLVHFIGDNKPWKQDRQTHGVPGAYTELLGRWWAVYDRHFKASDASRPAPATELPFTERQDIPESEKVDQGLIGPASTSQQRKFSAPILEWDATRAPPPIESKPEAANFPSRVYGFSSDVKPFQSPQNQWYEASGDKQRKEEKPRPIFPWEERADSKPTRRFIEDEGSPQASADTDEGADKIQTDEFSVEMGDSVEPHTPVIKVNPPANWDSFGAVNRNAWDEISGIENYVRALTAHQKTRGQVQVVQTDQPSTAQQHILSPSTEIDPDQLAEQVRERRESIILTDFPSAVERPSLPVTPAPRRRTSFWGDERDEEGNLPAAEGVPDQVDWDPSEQLEQLRRNSLIGPADLKLPPRKSIPNREKIPTAATIPEEANGHDVAHVSEPPQTGSLVNGRNTAPAFTDPAFSTPSSSNDPEGSATHEALSPSEAAPTAA